MEKWREIIKIQDDTIQMLKFADNIDFLADKKKELQRKSSFLGDIYCTGTEITTL